MNVLGDRRLLAVGHAVLAQVPLTEIRRHDLQIAAGVDLRLLAWRRATAKSLTTTPGALTLTALPGDTWQGNNSARNVTTGDNNISAGSFANMSGLPTVIQNSGANVLIQNATILNLQMN